MTYEKWWNILIDKLTCMQFATVIQNICGDADLTLAMMQHPCAACSRVLQTILTGLWEEVPLSLMRLGLTELMMETITSSQRPADHVWREIRPSGWLSITYPQLIPFFILQALYKYKAKCLRLCAQINDQQHLLHCFQTLGLISMGCGEGSLSNDVKVLILEMHM